jgi:sulfatase maturation enzyme AslB (radical SAM superfamily)
MREILRSWHAILMGRRPAMSIEITRECPLSCPGCYAYNDNHLGSGVGLRDVTDFKGDALVERVLQLARAERPLHISFVGGEPLVRFRELNRVLPVLSGMGIYTQVVTSAVRPIPPEWKSIRRLDVSVSIDGLQPQHDARRKPATYDRILKHIEGHQVTVHCTITRQMARAEGDVEAFVRYWSDVAAVKRIWFSLYTPQIGELSMERLTAENRTRVIGELGRLLPRYKKLALGPALLAAMASPPSSPDRCIFARTTRCVSADLEQTVTPCQFGGRPDCSNCGCMASAGLAALGRYRLPGGLAVETLFGWSFRVGAQTQRLRETVRGHFPDKAPETGRA